MATSTEANDKSILSSRVQMAAYTAAIGMVMYECHDGSCSLDDIYVVARDTIEDFGCSAAKEAASVLFGQLTQLILISVMNSSNETEDANTNEWKELGIVAMPFVVPPMIAAGTSYYLSGDLASPLVALASSVSSWFVNDSRIFSDPYKVSTLLSVVKVSVLKRLK